MATLKPGLPDPGQRGLASMQILNRVLEGGGRTVHQQLGDLSLSTVYALLATLMQCLSMGCLCVAISLLKWIIAVQPFYHRPNVLVTSSFGIPYDVSIYEPWNPNATDLRKYYFFSEEEVIEPVMITVCLLSLSSGFLAFLLGFVEVKKLGQYQSAVVTFLHILSGIFLTSLIVLCSWCLMKIRQRVNEEGWKLFRLKVMPGESFYIALTSFLFIILAVLFNLWSMTVSA
ncbi:uncharacterized protein LOC110090919 [Pogona vitticeps]